MSSLGGVNIAEFEHDMGVLKRPENLGLAAFPGVQPNANLIFAL